MTVAAVSAAGAGQQAAAAREGGGYGYMDDYKASMICSWVETQADAKFLTQFKQAADSSDSGSEHHTGAAAAVTTEIRADVHTPHVSAPSPPLPTPAFPAAETGMSPVTAVPAAQNSSKRGTPPVPPPRRSPSLVLSSGGGGGETVAAARLERPASDDSMEPLPEPDFEALDSCRLSSGIFIFLVLSRVH
jgi:hypothetical protein